MIERLSNEWPCDDCKRTAFCGACERPGIWMNKAQKKLAGYEIAEEEGRLIVLPCKIGTIVYVLRQSWNGWNIDKKKFSYAMIGKVGKTVFLTREEAEKTLKEMKNSE